MEQNQQIGSNKNLLKACYFALCGFKAAFQGDFAFRLEVFLSLIIIPLSLFLGVTAVEKSILISSWFLVLLMEVINSSIEAVVDRISLEIHPLSKKIKDMSSAAVLISIVNAAIVWLVTLVGRIF